MSRLLVRSLCLLAALLSGACSHYRLGTGVERDYETIFIPPIEANAQLPQATAVFTTQIREAFVRDGRLRVVNTPDEADAILTVKLEELDRSNLTALPTDSGLARKMGLTLTASATLREPSGEKTWFADRPISIERQLFTDDGSAAGPSFLQPTQQTQAEYQLVPQIGEALAISVKNAVLDTW
ncbi:MAG: LPS assembly lipoprotein LptE [Opitutaceae bacterium]|jgi:outer membrane lipopolysaccharide assembly protein LptE/RlpB|nr:LPS assembly lipoprotein LptE [Opitutaceae bacterium]